jgi:sugar phosphate isomerase/epimerase
MQLSRRSMMGASALAVSAASAAGVIGVSSAASSLGLVIHSFPVRTAGDRGRASGDRFSAPGRFVDFARALGAGGVQVGLGVLENAAADALRERVRAASMYLEGIAGLPRNQADVERFTAEIRTAKRAGAQVVRSVMLSGRRYETFKNIGAFRRFAESSAHSLKLAAAVVAREDVRLAIENHKDWRADELIRILKQAGNDHVGVCLDTGNSMALLEDPMDVVEALAPRAFTTHFKDMAVEEYKEGFLLSEVPLGTGVLDLPRVIRVVRAARPEIRLNLEMITRDPLKVPCLSTGYWPTFPDLPGEVMARALSLVRAHPPAAPLPRISQLAREEQLRVEDENVRLCLEFARDRLGLTS